MKWKSSFNLRLKLKHMCKYRRPISECQNSEYQNENIRMTKFPKFMSRCGILRNMRMSKLVILTWRHFEYKAKLKKRKNLKTLFRSKIGIFYIFFKRLYKESFQDLKSNCNWKFQTRVTMPNKMTVLLKYLQNFTKALF